MARNDISSAALLRRNMTLNSCFVAHRLSLLTRYLFFGVLTQVPDALYLVKLFVKRGKISEAMSILQKVSPESDSGSHITTVLTEPKLNNPNDVSTFNTFGVFDFCAFHR